MRPVRQSFSAGGAEIGAPIPIDKYLNPTNIGLSVDITATATFTVEHTFDDVFAEDFNPVTAVWYPHPTIAGDSANVDGNYAFPPSAIRLNIAANTGIVNFNVVQAGAVS